jgi:hypothetical protein
MNRLAIVVTITLAATNDLPAAPPDFDRDVAPVLVKRCAGCHSGVNPKGDLDLTRKANVLSGESPLVVAGWPEKSTLWNRVASGEMPPKNPLKEEEKDILKGWIGAGAKWGTDPLPTLVVAGDWWSFRPIRVSEIPPGVHPVDHFVNGGLKARGLNPVATADRRTLVRRLYFDLIGLPPTPERVDSFAADDRPDAYERLVDELLSSPRYGERWARHWLDVVHYGETHGYDKDKPRPHAWPYRDYVIRAFNSDKPYARFVREQIAGDRLFPGTADGIEALGFLAAGPWDFIGHAEVPESKGDGKAARHQDRDDFVSTTVGTFLSLTAHCAQCHDHKFDPISQREYYGLQAVFAAIDRTEREYDSDPSVSSQRIELRGRYAGVAAAFGAVAADRLRRELAIFPKPKTAYVGAVHTGSGNFVGTGARGGLPRAIHVLSRGDVRKPGDEIGPGALAAIPVKYDLPPHATESDRRAAFANWLTHADNPFLWRSLVNRVWMYHFGRGLVDTPNDFGRMGQIPTHPELLDTLAAEFRDGGGSIKSLHRRIVTSEAYRRSSDANRKNEAVDGENRFLWRQTRRKLEAEAVRDSILFVAGALDLTMGGPSFQDFVIEKPEHSPHYQYHLHDARDVKTHRRSVYRFVVRSKPQPFLAAFDCADPSQSVDKRNQSVTPQQALSLMNNNLTLVMAEALADRVTPMSPNLGERVAAAFRLATGRVPVMSERDILIRHAADYGLASACRVILNLNEFTFVD